ncbi:hypothetical protein SAMD00023353_8300030 [Rosellinia necatrix]|uniref:Uncharacterized protein n=1 Tax=Rosellinia necatrix TaxID=77044 RepID=A0A1S8AAU6_ROSNE|nr:hypothetical protein SAMD00023353_8300030 [Rosellinia necatrix]
MVGLMVLWSLGLLRRISHNPGIFTWNINIISFVYGCLLAAGGRVYTGSGRQETTGHDKQPLPWSLSVEPIRLRVFHAHGIGARAGQIHDQGPIFATRSSPLVPDRRTSQRAS